MEGPYPADGMLDTRLTTLLCYEINVAECKEVKTRSNLADSYKEGCGSKGASFANDDDLTNFVYYNLFVF
jgi:hypothetical protein